MIAIRLANALQRRGIHYAWVVAGLVFLTMLTSAAALGLPGALLMPLATEFGWRADQISSAIALRFLLFGFMGPFAAILMERYGLRSIVCTALVLCTSALLLGLLMTEVWQLVVLWGVLLGFGTGLTALVLGATVATRWFEQRRGLVVGVLTASSATGQLLFLPLAAWLIEHYGWRYSMLPVCIVACVVAVLVFALIRNHPRDVGQRAFGAAPQAPELHENSSQPKLPLTASLLEPFRVLALASRNTTFWVLAGTFFVCGLSTSGLIQTHFISLCGDNGLSAVPAASVLAMIGAFDLIGTIASGWLSDRYDSRKLLFWYYGLRGLSLLWLPHSEFSLYGLSLFAIFYGLDWIATIPPTVKLTTLVFDKRQASMVFGWIFAAHQLGSAAAAYGGGLSRTMLLSYNPALYTAGIACVLAAVAIFLIRPQVLMRSAR